MYTRYDMWYARENLSCILAVFFNVSKNKYNPSYYKGAQVACTMNFSPKDVFLLCYHVRGETGGLEIHPKN